MQVKFRSLLTSQELFALVARAEQTLQDFQVLPEKNGNSAEFAAKTALSKFSLPSGITPMNVGVIIATFKPKSDPVEELCRIALLAEPQFQQFGSFDVKCLFKPEGIDNVQRPDKCGIMFWREKIFFAYECRIERPQSRNQYFRRLISQTGLPIAVSETERGYFLQHTQNGLLRPLTTGVFGENTWGFWCELTDQHLTAAFPFVRAAIGNALVSEVEWIITPGQGRQLSLEKVLAQNFPCSRFDIGFTYVLKNLGALEQLPSVKMSRGFFETDIVRFKMRGEISTLKVRTSPRGHILYADIEPVDLDELNQKLGVAFVPDE